MKNIFAILAIMAMLGSLVRAEEDLVPDLQECDSGAPPVGAITSAMQSGEEDIINYSGLDPAKGRTGASQSPGSKLTDQWFQ